MLKRLLTAIDLLCGMPILLLRHRRGFLDRMRECLRGGSNALRELVIWSREMLAFERRSSDQRYRRWLMWCERRERSHPHDSPGDVASLTPSGGRLRSADFDRIGARYVLIESPSADLSPGGRRSLRETAERSGADVVYCDEDFTDRGRRGRPRFKPAFSIDLLRTEDYIGPVYLVAIQAAMNALARLDDEDGCTPFELLLGLAEIGARVVRLAEVLVHWSELRESSLTPPMQRAVEEHCARMYGAASGNVSTPVGRSATSVSIIIPTRDRLDLLVPCVNSILEHGAELDFEIIVLDNRSELDETRRWLERASSAIAGLTVIEADFPFNWSRLNNLGAAHADGNLLLFLNNDIEVTHSGWMEILAASAARPDVGVAGPLLLYPNGGIQHAGIVVGLGGYIDHVYAGFPDGARPGPLFVSPFVRRNVLGVTGACQMVERRKFEIAGRFDENLPICGDIGLSLTLIERGFLNVYDPEATLVHHESATRPRVPITRAEMDSLAPLSERYLRSGDPYFNPNLSLDVRIPALACRPTGATVA